MENEEFRRKLGGRSGYFYLFLLVGGQGREEASRQVGGVRLLLEKYEGGRYPTQDPNPTPTPNVGRFST